MRVTYDRETDTLVITLRNVRIRESDEVQPGVIAVLAMMAASYASSCFPSQVVDKTTEMQFAVAT